MNRFSAKKCSKGNKSDFLHVKTQRFVLHEIPRLL